jgi:hemerythrin
MESQKYLNDNIRLTTLKIQEEHPELIKYINEIPRNYLVKKEGEVNNKALKEYLDSLNNILETYSKKH